jgi:hypothetical protein
VGTLSPDPYPIVVIEVDTQRATRDATTRRQAMTAVATHKPITPTG